MVAVTQPDRQRMSSEDRLGYVIAIAAHGALVLLLLVQPAAPLPAPESRPMTVSLVEEVGRQSVAPVPVPESRAAIAPTLAETPAPIVEQRTERPTSAIASERRAASAERSARVTPTPPRPERAASPAGGSRIGRDFLAGAGASSRTNETRAPGTRAGAQATASIVQAITRQIKPHWSAPSGVDSERLVTILAFDLNRDGSLRGRPRVVSQSGVTDANAPQKALHGERAIRAVQLAAPFDLPVEYYDDWKTITGARFDRNLSQ
jgi:hypothetical protein